MSQGSDNKGPIAWAAIIVAVGGLGASYLYGNVQAAAPMIEVATQILSSKPSSHPGDRALREWAVHVMQTPIFFPRLSDEQAAYLLEVPLPGSERVITGVGHAVVTGHAPDVFTEDNGSRE